jgi:predicted MFS family arabinose efflux permease
MMSQALCGEEPVSSCHPGGGATPLSRREWLLLLVLAAVQFTHIVDFMIIMPLGPVYMREMGLSSYQFGSVVAAYTIAAGLAGLLAARVVDRFDRKSALLTLYAGFTAGTFFCAIAPNYPLLLAARTVAGGFGGVSAAVILAIIGDTFADARRGFATGVIMSSFSVASIVGVPLGLQLADTLGWHAPFAALAALSLAVLTLAAMVLPPLRGHFHDHTTRPGTTWDVLTDPNHLRAFALMVALVLSTSMIVPFLATYLVANVGLRQDELKYMYLCGGLATLLMLAPVGRLADRFGKLPVFRVLAIATLASIISVTNLPRGLSLTVVLVLTTVFMVTTAGRMVPAMALITASSAPRERGSFMSLNAAVQHLSLGAAAELGGVLLPLDAQGAMVGFPFIGLIACLATAVSLVLAGRLRPAPGGDLAPDSLAVAEAAAAAGP